ncbi:hypothetical protein PTKIN_Ptkin05aG0042400 [Pterospermum kingtungense]
MSKTYPDVGKEYRLDIKMAMAKLRALIVKKNCAPSMLQMGWKSAGFFETIARDVGVQVETSDDEGMKNASSVLEQIKKQFPRISYADLHQLAGVVAIEVAGGPEIPFHPGRQDFAKLSLSDAEVVALAAGYFLGHWSKENGTWTVDTHFFDNSYYKMLLEADEEHSTNPIDEILMCAPYRPWVEKFASDEVALHAEYEAAHLKLSELGYSTEESHGVFSALRILDKLGLSTGRKSK